MKDRILITGAQGFVGRYLVAHWLQSDAEVEILGIGRSSLLLDGFTHTVHHGNREIRAPLPACLRTDPCRRYSYLSLDVRQKSEVTRVLHEFRPSLIVHMASFLRDNNATQDYRTNVEGTVGLIEAIAGSHIAIAKLVIGSTGGVYGAAALDKDLPLKETSPCVPVDPYAASKLKSEQVSSVLVKKHSIPAVWVRLFNLVGPGQQELHVCGRFASQIAAIVGGSSLPVMTVRSLQTTRDFIDVRDVALGLELLADKGNPGEIYNLGSGEETLIATVLETFLAAAKLTNVQINCISEPNPSIPRHFACIDLIRGLGFKCRYNLRQSITSVLDYYLHDVAQSVDSLYSRRL